MRLWLAIPAILLMGAGLPDRKNEKPLPPGKSAADVLTGKDVNQIVDFVKALGAQQGSALYPTVAAGLLATTEGGLFAVVGDPSTDYATVQYRKEAGAAVEVARHPTKETVDQVDRRVADAEATHAADKAAQATRDAGQDSRTEGLALGVPGDPSALAVQATGSMTPRSLAARAADVANVLDFGAKADGITNDTAAFYAAANARRRVFVPAGTYRVNLDLTQVNANGLIVEGVGYGNGSNGTTLKGFDDTKPVLSGIFTAEAPASKITLRDLTISQSGGSNSITNHGIALTYAHETTLTNVHVINVGGWGIRLERAVTAWLNECEVYKGSMTRGLGGIYLGNGSYAVTLHGGRLNALGPDDTTPAIKTEGWSVANLSVYGTTIEHYGIGVLIDNSQGHHSGIDIRAHFEMNTLADIQLGVMGADSTYVQGFRSFSTHAGPTQGANTHLKTALRLWARKTYNAEIQIAGLIDRAAAIVLDNGAEYYDVNVTLGYHGDYGTGSYIPALTGSLRTGVTINDSGKAYAGMKRFADGDTTPSVREGQTFEVWNTAPTTITALDHGAEGQQVTILFVDDFTTVDFTSGAGKNLIANNRELWKPTTNDAMTCTFTSYSRWKCSLSEVRNSGRFKLPDDGAAPVCDASRRGTLWFTYRSTGEKDSFHVCAKDVEDVYGWRTLY